MNQQGRQRWNQKDYQARAIDKAQRIGRAYGLNSLDARLVATEVVARLVTRWRKRPMPHTGIANWWTDRKRFEWHFGIAARLCLRHSIEARLEQRIHAQEQRQARRQRLAELLGVRP